MNPEDLEAGTTDGTLAQRRAIVTAARIGHDLSAWEPYGFNSMKARCRGCGAEARLPFSVARGQYREPEGPAVNPSAGTCAHQSRRHPRRRRGIEENPMAKAMKTPNAPGANMPTKAAHSFGRQTMGSPTVDDISSTDFSHATLRAKKGSGKSDAPDDGGDATHRGRSATNASAQFRISVSHRAPQPETAPGTQASGRILPSVMGSKQSFAAGMQSGL